MGVYHMHHELLRVSLRRLEICSYTSLLRELYAKTKAK